MCAFLFLILGSPSSSFAEWTKFGSSTEGVTFYYKNLKRVGINIFYEEMNDKLRPDQNGVMCTWKYLEVNCINFMFKRLNFQSYSRPLCQGKGDHNEKAVIEYLKKNEKWNESIPNSIGYDLVIKLCE